MLTTVSEDWLIVAGHHPINAASLNWYIKFERILQRGLDFLFVSGMYFETLKEFALLNDSGMKYSSYI